MTGDRDMAGTLRPVCLSGAMSSGDPEHAFRLTAAMFGQAMPRLSDDQPDNVDWLDGIEDVSSPGPGYAGRAISSYKIFRRLRDAGKLPEGVRFQVTLPSPGTLLTENFRESADAQKSAIETVMLHELAKVVAEIPRGDLAISWRVTDVFFTLESGRWSDYIKGDFEKVVADLARLGDAVPQGVELGFDLTYGNLDRQFLGEQSNAARMVAFINGILPKMGRTIDWISIPVPADRDTPDYFMPLAALRRYKQTQVFLGLLQPDEDLSNAQERLAAAARYLPGLGIAASEGTADIPPEQLETFFARLRSLAERQA